MMCWRNRSGVYGTAQYQIQPGTTLKMIVGSGGRYKDAPVGVADDLNIIWWWCDNFVARGPYNEFHLLVLDVVSYIHNTEQYIFRCRFSGR